MKIFISVIAMSLLISISSPANALGGGPGHVVHCSYEGTNSPNHSWSTVTADGDDTIHAANLCLNQGGNVTIAHASLNPKTVY